MEKQSNPGASATARVTTDKIAVVGAGGEYPPYAGDSVTVTGFSTQATHMVMDGAVIGEDGRVIDPGRTYTLTEWTTEQRLRAVERAVGIRSDR
jgi:hypothetical protein